MERPRLLAVEITDVLRAKGIIARRQAHGHLKERAERKHRDGRFDRQRQRLRDVASGPPQHRRPAWPGPRHRVVGAAHDVPVVQQEDIGDPREALESIAVGPADRFVARVAGCHDEGVERRVAEELDVERRRGQHDAKVRQAGRDARRDRGVGKARGEKHRRPRRREQRLVLRLQRDQPAGGREVANHECERLGRPPLALAQLRHDRLVVGAARELKPAEPLDCDDHAPLQRGTGQLDRIGTVRPEPCARLLHP